MKRIFVCSPLRGDIEANMGRARQYCRQVVEAGHLPYAPHLFFTQFLDDTVVAERWVGIRLGLKELEACDEVWAFGTPTEGMQAEIALAERLGIPVVPINPAEVGQDPRAYQGA